MSRRINLHAFAAFVGATTAFAAACAYAAQATSQFQVTANVAASCTLGSTNVAFGAYDPLGAGNIQATGTLTLTCVKGTAPTSIDLDNGTSGSRQMTGVTPGNTDVITYELYKPTSNAAGAACAYTTVWGAGAINGLVPTPAPSKAPRTYNVCGQAALGQDVSADNYSQTITATINF